MGRRLVRCGHLVQRRAVRAGSRAGSGRGGSGRAPERTDRRLQVGASRRERVLRVPRLDRRQRRPRRSSPADRSGRRTRSAAVVLEVFWPRGSSGPDRDGRRRCAGGRSLAQAGIVADPSPPQRRPTSPRRPLRIARPTARTGSRTGCGTGSWPEEVDERRDRSRRRPGAHRHRLRALRRPDAPPVLLVMGLGAQMLGWPDGFCDALVAHGAARHPVRQPRHRPVESHDGCAAARRARGAARRHLVGVVHAVGHGRRRRRAARRARAGQRAPRRRVDGRDDRADGRDRAPAPRALADLDHVEHRRSLGRAGRRRRRLAALLSPPAATRAEAIDRTVSDRSRDRLAGLRARRGRTCAGGPGSPIDRADDPVGVGRQLVAIAASGRPDRGAAVGVRARRS